MQEGFKIHPKYSHLEQGYAPIRVSLGDIYYDRYNFFREKEETMKKIEKAENVDYAGHEGYFKKNKMLNGGHQTYVISDLNTKDKYTKGMFDCTSVVIVASDKNTGKNVSVLSHQDPKEFLDDDLAKEFQEHLSLTLQKIKECGKKGSIDAIIIGGNIYAGGSLNFKKSIKTIGDLIKEQLGFEPTVVHGPKQTTGSEDIFLDTANRRLYSFMPQQYKTILYEDFKPSQVEEQIKKINRKKPDIK